MYCYADGNDLILLHMKTINKPYSNNYNKYTNCCTNTPTTTQTNAASLLEVNHQQHQHEIDVREHTTSYVKKIHSQQQLQRKPLIFI